jgi:hypothetical protein
MPSRSPEVSVPPTEASRNVTTPVPQDIAVPVAAATATLYAVSAVASLTRLSPVNTIMIRRGRPSLRPIATAAAASGGATIAPSTSDADGISRCATRPTPSVVASTSTSSGSSRKSGMPRHERGRQADRDQQQRGRPVQAAGQRRHRERAGQQQEDLDALHERKGYSS